ncbi:MAG: hypothetical protein RIE77_02535 [Phycisphaerales bacterium]|jgi:hypothetical protein
MIYTLLAAVRIMLITIVVALVGLFVLQVVAASLVFQWLSWQPPAADQERRMSDARAVMFAASGGTMDRSWVEGRFGQPQNVRDLAQWDQVFILGPEPGLLSFDDLWLCVEYDDDGFVKAATITDR